MLEGAIDQATTPSGSVSCSSSSRQTSHLETGFSRSTSSNNTPTSSTAPPSASAHHPPHDVPAYVDTNNTMTTTTTTTAASNHPSQPRSLNPSFQPFSRASSNPPASAFASAHSSMSTTSVSANNALPTAYPPSERARPLQSTPNSNQASNTTEPAMSHDVSQLSPSSPRLRPAFRSLCSLEDSKTTSPSRIKVRDLSHIQSFASEQFLAQKQQSQLPGQSSQDRRYEISSMPVTDIIEMVAGLLSKITATNDMHHEHIHRHIPPPDGDSDLSPQATSVLAFHGKNVPSITILSYLSRINKYCPTTYEVFLSLLVYFDRMTEMVNQGHLARLRRRWTRTPNSQRNDVPRPASADSMGATSSIVTPPSSERLMAQDLKRPESSISPSLYPEDGTECLSHFFVVDSFNIHRLVIAGVTCASKFFSDVFYTNSRYAKVGGLPLVELNHLELQFLLLNDFRLAIPVEELEAYGTMLVEFYAREIVAKKQRQQQQMEVPPTVHSPEHPGTRPEDIHTRTHVKRSSSQPEVSQTPTPP